MNVIKKDTRLFPSSKAVIINYLQLPGNDRIANILNRTKNLDEATLKAVAGLHPIGRLGTSEEVAELALWLNSDKASFVTGSYYNVDGGYLAQ